MRETICNSLVFELEKKNVDEGVSARDCVLTASSPDLELRRPNL